MTAAIASRREDSRKLLVSRVPSEAPIATCAALISTTGTPDGRCPVAASPIARPQGPSIQGLAMPAVRSGQASASPPAAIASSPGHQIGCRGAMNSPKAPCGASQPSSGGKVSTTTSTRMVCARVTVATEALASCASIAMTITPPGTAQKKPVCESVPASRVNSRATTKPVAMAMTPPASSTGSAPLTAASTGPEKVAPRPSPRKTSPVGRAQPGTATGRCQASAAVATIAPIIQASGTCSSASSPPPRAAIPVVRSWVGRVRKAAATIGPAARSVKPPQPMGHPGGFSLPSSCVSKIETERP